MDGKTLLRSIAPLALLLALALTAAEVPLPVSALRLSPAQEGAYAYQDLTHLLPEGVDALRDAAPTGSGALLAGRSWSGHPFLASYDASRPDAEPSWVLPPDHYGDVRTLAQVGGRYLVGGESVGPAPVLGVYDPTTAALSDLSPLLPPGVTAVEGLVGHPTDTGLAVLRNASALVPALVRPTDPSVQAREVPGFENLSAMATAVWNGSAFYVAGPTLEGGPSLLAWNPGTDAVTDLAPQVAEELDRIDRLVWNGTVLFVLGTELGPFPFRGVVLSYHPETGSLERVGEDAFHPFDRMEAAAWNGTALLIVGQQGAARRLAVYTPANDTVFVPDDVIPTQWAYLALLPRGDDALLVGNDAGPALGLLRTLDWSFTDRSHALDRGYRMVADAAAWGPDFALAGFRTASAALGLLRTGGLELEDRSGDLGLKDVIFLGATRFDDGLLLVGTNGTSASLHTYTPDEGRLTNRTAEVPPEVTWLAWPVTNGSIVLALGSQADRPFLLQVDPGGELRNRSAGLDWYFTDVWRVVPRGDAFLLLGRNDQGPALATFHPGNGTLIYHGSDLGRILGVGAALHAGAASESGVLLGGAVNGGPWMGLWAPGTDLVEDLSSRLPEGWTGVTDIAPLGTDFLVGGTGDEGGGLAVYHIANGSFTDVSALLPSSYQGVLRLAPGEDATLVVGSTAFLSPAVGLLTVEPEEGGMTNLLEDLGLNPLLVAVIGLSAALAAALGYLLGRRRGASVIKEEVYYEGPGPGEY